MLILGLLTSVQVIFVIDTVVSYYFIYYEYYLNRRYYKSIVICNAFTTALGQLFCVTDFMSREWFPSALLN